MTTTKSSGLTPRHLWLHDRVRECIDALHRQDLNEDYDAYRIQAKQLAEELLYAVTEWEKFYEDEKKESGKCEHERDENYPPKLSHFTVDEGCVFVYKCKHCGKFYR